MNTDFPSCLGRAFGVLLAAWSLLLFAFTLSHAETTVTLNMLDRAEGAFFSNANEDYAQQVSSSLLPRLSDITQTEDRRGDQLKLAGLQPDPYRTPSENKQGPMLSENSSSPLAEGVPITSGAFNNPSAGLLSSEVTDHFGEATAGRFNRFACSKAISPLRTDRITYNRSLLAGIDGSTPEAPEPSEDQSCEMNGQSPYGDQVTGVVFKKDWPGLWRDTAYFFGYQFVIVGLLYVLPESVTKWTKEQKEEYSLERWWKNVTHPEWDNDTWYVNYVFHPYWGAIYYIRARERGFDKLESFVYSAFLSGLFEFGVEALFEKPSYQDLIVTPVAGTVLGMYVFEPIRDNIKAKGPDQKWYDKVALVLTDPLGAISDLTDKLLGIKSSVRITHPSPSNQKCRPVEGNSAGLGRTAGDTSCHNSYTGLELTFKW